jgi:hypothetical protein
MTGPMRIEWAGAWYHITARGNERRAIYRDNRDRQHFWELLAEMMPRFYLELGARLRLRWCRAARQCCSNTAGVRIRYLDLERSKTIPISPGPMPAVQRQ